MTTFPLQSRPQYEFSDADWALASRLANEPSFWDDFESDPLWALEEGQGGTSTKITSASLFEVGDADALETAANELVGDRLRGNDALLESLCEAFRSVAGGRSTECVIADPLANASFVQACWSAGHRLSQFDANWMLMWCRKNNRLGPIPGVKPTSLSRDDFDACGWAAEAALSTLQAYFYFSRQATISLDRLLCHPILAQEFDRLAARFAGGFTSFQYRYAAFTIRKQPRKPKGKINALPQVERFGVCKQVRPSLLPAAPGVIVLRSGDLPILHTAVSNIRIAFDRAMQNKESLWMEVPEWAAEHPRVCSAVAGTLPECDVISMPGVRSTERLAEAKALSMSGRLPIWNICGPETVEQLRALA